MTALMRVVDKRVQAGAVGGGFPAEFVRERLIEPSDGLVMPAGILIEAAHSKVAEFLPEKGI